VEWICPSETFSNSWFTPANPTLQPTAFDQALTAILGVAG
jgi:hypothetical protein